MQVAQEKETITRDTICDIVRRHAERAPDAPALLAAGQQPLTYGELAKLMDRIRERFNDLGFGREDRIAVVGPNDPGMAALMMGVWDCAAAAPMNPAYTVGEFAIYLRDLKVQAVAVDADLDTACREAARGIGLPIFEVERVDDRVAGMIDIRSAPTTGRTARPGATQMDDLAVVLATSGTTSHSKIVPLTHRQLSKKLDLYATPLKLTPADRCLNPMPLFHVSGLLTSLGSTLYSGGSVILLPEYSADAFFHLLETLRPTWLSASYTFHHTICAAAPNYGSAVENSRLRVIRTGSGHLDSRIADKLEKMFGAPVIETYATTETGPICTNPLPPGVAKRGTTGIVTCDGVAIMGPDNRLLPQGQSGEVVVRTAKTFGGYENDSVANAQTFVDGWFRTGDEGVFDEDGYLTLTGRIKDMINRGGEKITPSEIDEVLMSHPDVSAAVAFPVEHPTLGQDVAAAVVPVRGATPTEESLAAFVRGKLAPFKVPRQIVIVDKMPETAQGKFPRRIMAEALGLGPEASQSVADDASGRMATPLEARLQSLWAETLGLEHVGLDEDFFVLGGDSLQAVELFFSIEEEFERSLPRAILFEAGTVAKMARFIEKLDQESN